MVRYIRRGIICLLLLLLLLALSACQLKRLIPWDGVWISEDGAICINMEELNQSFYTINGEKVRCEPVNPKGSQYIRLWSSENVEGCCDAGECLFKGKSIRYDDQTWEILDETDGQVIRFLKNDP